MRKDVPVELRKFSRQKRKEMPSVPQEINDAAALLTLVEPNANNTRQVSDGLAECHCVLEHLLFTGSTVQQILSQLPHLNAYHGLMVSKSASSYC